MKATTWAAVAAGGFGLMLLSYFGLQRIDPAAPCASAIVMVGHGPSLPGSDLPAFHTLPLHLRLLPGGAVGRAIMEGMSLKSPGGVKSIEAQVRPKLFLLDPAAVGIGPQHLLSGRMPKPGAEEILAGCQAPWADQVTAGGRTLQVVGILRPDVALLAGNYLIPPDAAASALFFPSDPDVRPGVLIVLSPAQLADAQIRKQLAAAYPKDRFATVAPMLRATRGAYYLYLAGLALLLLGGSGGLIGLYRWLAPRVARGPLRRPLEALAAHRRLLWSVHLACFGASLLVALLIYELPEVQTILLANTRSEITSGKGPLAMAGRAYLSGNIPRAAAVTFLINFVLGTVACITLPSLVIPGIGALVTGLRLAVWGLILAPTFVALSAVMLPHSWTLLLEGEGYILGAFFALLIPITLFQPSQGPTIPRRYGQAALLNLQGTLLIALILAVAACYEAVEVIWMARG